MWHHAVVKIVAYVPDLMDKSRFGPVSAVTTFVTTPEALSDAKSDDIAVADLRRDGSLEALANAKQAARRVGFISHEDREVIAKAKEVGIDALPRGRFFSRIAEILGIE